MQACGLVNDNTGCFAIGKNAIHAKSQEGEDMASILALWMKTIYAHPFTSKNVTGTSDNCTRRLLYHRANFGYGRKMDN